MYHTAQVIFYSLIAIAVIVMMIYLMFLDNSDEDIKIFNLEEQVKLNQIKSTDILEKQMNRELKKASKLNLINYETVDQNESTID